jgi:hypothetical protein
MRPVTTIRVVDQRVEELERLPHLHPLPIELQVIALLVQHEVERLVRVIEPVELLDGVARLGRVVAELLGGLADGAAGWRRLLLHGRPRLECDWPAM